MVCAMLMLPFLLLLQGPQTQSQSLVKVYPCFVDPLKVCPTCLMRTLPTQDSVRVVAACIDILHLRTLLNLTASCLKWKLPCICQKHAHLEEVETACMYG